MAKYILLLVLALAPPWSLAGVFDEGDAIFVQTSLWTVHYNPSDDHVNQQRAIITELNKASGWLFGLGFFQNSFGQPSQYLYTGHTWTLPKTRKLVYFKITGGLLHGYKGEYQDAIPFNSTGIAPAILPSFGVKYKRVQAELVLFGTAGLMLTVGVNFPKGPAGK